LIQGGKPLNRKVLTVTLALLLLGTCSIPICALNTWKSQSSKGNWLYVGGSGPSNYTQIQDAIDNASNGDTIFVFNDSSPYNEYLMINKSINLFGENNVNTVISYSWSDEASNAVITVKSPFVQIKNFSIKGGDSWGNQDFGIRITSSNNRIENNYIKLDYLPAGGALYFSGSFPYGINHSTVAHNTFYSRVVFDRSSDNYVENNLIIQGPFDLYMGESNILVGNSFENGHSGLRCMYSNNNTIENNTFKNNNYGFYIEMDQPSSTNKIYHNNFLNNSISAYDIGDNIWDDGYPSGGNYWSDYTGVDNDGDGIGDTPYNISGESTQDHYPFMEPNGWLNESPDLHIDFSTIGIGVNAIITNNGIFNATNVEWQLQVRGGILGLINTTVDGLIDIPRGESRTVRTGPFIGLGPFTVFAKVNDDEREATGIILLFYVIHVTGNGR
jgi:parallel beta-helix repeat protein